MGNKHSMVKELAAIAYEDAHMGRYRHRHDASIDSSSVMSSSPRSSTASGPYERVQRQMASSDKQLNTDSPRQPHTIPVDVAGAQDSTFDSTDSEHARFATLCNIDDEDSHNNNDVVCDKTIHAVPMIIEVPPDEQELTEMCTLSREFPSRYGKDTPNFFNGSLTSAVQEITTSDGSNVTKPILIYLHHAGNPDTDAFAKNVLCCTDFVEYANNTFLIWGWNMKDGPDRQKFHQMVEPHLDSETITRILTFGVNDYPILVLLLKTSSEIALSQVVDGKRTLDEIIAILMTAHEVFKQMQHGQVENPEIMDLDSWGKKLWKGQSSNSNVAKQLIPREQKISIQPQVAHVAPTVRRYQRAKPNHYEFADPTKKTKVEDESIELEGKWVENVTDEEKPTYDEVDIVTCRIGGSNINSSLNDAQNKIDVDKSNERMKTEAEITHYKKIITETASMLTELQDGVEDELEKLKACVAEKDQKIAELQNRIAQHIYENIPADNIHADAVEKQKVSGDWSV